MCWSNTFYFSEDSKMYLNLCWSNRSHAFWDKNASIVQMYLNFCPIPPRTQNAMTEYKPSQLDQKMHFNLRCPTVPKPAGTQHALNKLIQCQREHKIYLNLCWTYCSYPSRTQTASQHVIIKSIPCQRGRKKYVNLFWPNPRQKIYLNQCWQNPSQPRRDTWWQNTF